MNNAQLLLFPAIRSPDFERHTDGITCLVRKSVEFLEQRLLRIASSEYRDLLRRGMPPEVAMERAGDLLDSLFQVAEQERRKVLRPKGGFHRPSVTLIENAARSCAAFSGR
jgi:hypothetical protein